MKKVLFLVLSFIPHLLQAQAAIDTNAVTVTSDTTKAKKDPGKISFGPGIMDFSVSRGQSKTQTFFIINRKSRPIAFKIFVEDVTFDSVYKFLFHPPGTTPTSCANWITIDKSYIEVPANSTGKLLVTLTAPDTEEADREAKWAVFKVHTEQEAQVYKHKDNVSTSFTPVVGVTVQVYQSPPNALKDIKMLSFVQKNDSTLRAVFENPGYYFLHSLRLLPT